MNIEWNYQGSDIGKSNLCMKMKGLSALKETIKAVQFEVALIGQC